jgi:hypothetical protein
MYLCTFAFKALIILAVLVLTAFKERERALKFLPHYRYIFVCVHRGIDIFMFPIIQNYLTASPLL